VDLHNGLDIEVYDLRPTDLHYYYYYYYITQSVHSSVPCCIGCYRRYTL